MKPVEKNKINTGRVGVAELTALLTIYTVTDAFLSYPSRVAKESATSAWMIPLISGAVVLAAFLLAYWCMKRFPQSNILEVATKFLTPYVSIPITVIYVAFFVLQAAFVTREFTETVVTTVLPATPAVIVALLFLLVALYYAYKGLEGLTRVSIFLAPILGLGLVLLLLMPLKWFDPNMLQPFWGRGIPSTLRFGLSNASMFMNVLLLTILYPAVRNQRRFTNVGIISIVLTALIFSAVVAELVGTFAGAPNGEVPFPLYQLARLIYVGRFVQRLEAVFVFLWTALAIIKVGLALWTAAYLYATAFRMPIYRPLLFPLTVIVYILGFLPADFVTVQKISSAIIEPYGWIIDLALPLVVVVIAALWSHFFGDKRDGSRRPKKDNKALRRSPRIRTKAR